MESHFPSIIWPIQKEINPCAYVVWLKTLKSKNMHSSSWMYWASFLSPAKLDWSVLIQCIYLLTQSSGELISFPSPECTEPCLHPPQSLNYQYTYSMNALLLILPIWLCFDWSMGCVPVIVNFSDPRLLTLPVLWVSFVMLLRRGMAQGRGSQTSR